MLRLEKEGNSYARSVMRDALYQSIDIMKRSITEES